METGKSNGKVNGGMDKDAISKKLEQIYKRLEFIDADSADSRAASILAVSLKSHPIIVYFRNTLLHIKLEVISTKCILL